jgi:hypothetical protein
LENNLLLAATQLLTTGVQVREREFAHLLLLTHWLLGGEKVLLGALIEVGEVLVSFKRLI